MQLWKMQREKGKWCWSKVQKVHFILNWSHRIDLFNGFILIAIVIVSELDSDHSLPSHHVVLAICKSSPVVPSMTPLSPRLAKRLLFIPNDPSDNETGRQTTSSPGAGVSNSLVNFSMAGASSTIPGPFDLDPVTSSPYVTMICKVFSIFSDTTPYIYSSPMIWKSWHMICGHSFLPLYRLYASE